MDLTVTNLTLADISQAIRTELETFFAEKKLAENLSEDKIGGIELAMKLTGKAKPTIYALVSARRIPHSKQGKRLYFSRRELLEWLQSGKRKTHAEIATEAANFGQKNMEAIQSAKTKNRSHKG